MQSTEAHASPALTTTTLPFEVRGGAGGVEETDRHDVDRGHLRRGERRLFSNDAAAQRRFRACDTPSLSVTDEAT